jgi:DUF4097 and DUF4098 domain-containing protein YvlB
MWNERFKKGVVLILAVTGMIGVLGCLPKAKYETTRVLSGPIAAGGNLTATTHNGAITVTGGEFSECTLTAKIITKADTEENARKLSDLVEVKLEETAEGAAVVIDKPGKLKDKYVVVELDISLPSDTSLNLKTHNGAIHVVNIEGNIDAGTHNGAINAKDVGGDGSLTTHNGQIVCSNVKGALKLKTHNGSVDCDGASGDIDARTHNGHAKIDYSDTADAVIIGHIETHNGSITLKAPPELSAELDASTHNGSINSELPVVISGEIKKTQLKGTIGTGEGRLFLKTYNGSITIK